MTALERIQTQKLVPVLRAPSKEEALNAIDALYDAGIEIFEITMTVPQATEVIETAIERYKDAILVGAGTVLSASAAYECLDAGAQFLVTPIVELEVISVAKSKKVPIAVGALTPTEVYTAYRAGADVIKIFPCEAVGGASYIKNLKGPFPQIQTMPTGGVTLENIPEFLKAGAIAVGVGSNLVDLNLLKTDRKKFVAQARAFQQQAMF